MEHINIVSKLNTALATGTPVDELDIECEVGNVAREVFGRKTVYQRVFLDLEHDEKTHPPQYNIFAKVDGEWKLVLAVKVNACLQPGGKYTVYCTHVE